MIDKGAIVNLLIPSLEKKYMPSTIRKYIDDFFTQLKIYLITILQSHIVNRLDMKCSLVKIRYNNRSLTAHLNGRIMIIFINIKRL